MGPLHVWWGFRRTRNTVIPRFPLSSDRYVCMDFRGIEEEMKERRHGKLRKGCLSRTTESWTRMRVSHYSSSAAHLGKDTRLDFVFLEIFHSFSSGASLPGQSAIVRPLSLHADIKGSCRHSNDAGKMEARCIKFCSRDH